MTAPPTSEAAAPEAAATPEPPLPPFSIARGTRLQLGARRGVVEGIRWSGSHPYDVKVRWEGEKYPQYFLHRTLELSYAQRLLKVL